MHDAEKDAVTQLSYKEPLNLNATFLQALLQHTRDILLALGQEGQIIYANAALTTLLGYQPEEWIGSLFLDALHREDRAKLTRTFGSLREINAAITSIELRFLHKAGGWLWMEATFSDYLEDSGIEHKFVTLRDINTQKQFDSKQRELQKREQAVPDEIQHMRLGLYNLFMSAPAVVCILEGPEHIYRFANPLYIQIIGKRDILGKPIREALPELEGQGIFELLDQVYTTGQPFIAEEYKVDLDRHGNGVLEEVYFSFIYQPSIDTDGRINGILVHATEVTEQVIARRTMEMQAIRLQKLMNANIIGLTFTSANGSIKDANNRFLEMVGYTRADLEAKKLSWSRMTPPEYASLDSRAIEEIRQTGAVSRPYEKEYVRQDGRRIPVLVGGAMLDAKLEEIVTFVIDIQEQKRIEKEREQAREQLETILKNVADGITVQDNQGRVIFVNDVAAKMSGFAYAEEMLASLSNSTFPLQRFLIKDQDGNTLSRHQLPGQEALESGKGVQKLVEYTDTLTGERRWSIIKAQPIVDEFNQPVLVVNVLVDITEQQLLEERKNEFISMASHELKTPITALKGFVNILQRRLDQPDREQTHHYLARMDSQLNKLTKLVNDLLDISKMQAGKLIFQEERMNLTELIHEIVDNVQGTTSTHRIYTEDLPPLTVKGDRDRLGQVLINLLTNAIKYSPQANLIIVRASQHEEMVQVSVQDFGIGIAEKYHQHIFERFYQVTDPEEKTYPGLGIGLYITHEIIKRHQGHIWVESAKGQGSTFCFALPAYIER